MMLRCRICNVPFRDEEEIRFIGDAFWHELGSKVTYSISKPHNVLKDSLAHTKCLGGYED